VPYQNSTEAMHVGTIASIRRGRPANPINIPKIGIQIPKRIACCMAGLEVCHSLVRASKSITAQIPTLRRGADNPARLARDRQSERVGTCRYFTHPHRRISGETTHTALMIAQSTTKYYVPSQQQSTLPAQSFRIGLKGVFRTRLWSQDDSAGDFAFSQQIQRLVSFSKRPLNHMAAYLPGGSHGEYFPHFLPSTNR